MGLRPLLREGNIVSTDYAYSRVPFVLDPFDNEKFKKKSHSFLRRYDQYRDRKAGI